MTPETKIGLGAGYESGTLVNSETGSSTTTSVYKWSADIEHLVHLGETPASVFLKYEGYHNAGAGVDVANNIEYVNQDSHSVMVGLNIKFGTTSLIEQDRHGANTDIDIGHISMIDTGYRSVSPP